MHVDTTTTRRGRKVYIRHLLRTSYRENGKVKHQTLANLSACSDEEIAALKLALKHKTNLTELGSLQDVQTSLGKSIGAVWALLKLAERLGLTQALGSSRDGKLALLQVMARLIDQGSRLSAVRLAMRHALCELLSLDTLNEDDLYANLDWLAEQQETLEQRLYRRRFGQSPPTLFLYDVTSAYLEGEHNAYAAYGYNRDRKRGKKQIVVGLLTGADGLPVAVRVFKGNTADPSTVAQQVRVLTERFGVSHVTLVGDRGMLRGPQIEALPQAFHYITAISKPQIRTLLTQGVLQLELFNDQVCDVDLDGVRHILRRNPVRAQQIAGTRVAKRDALAALAEAQTRYLAEHPKASVDKAVARVTTKTHQLQAQTWLRACAHERTIELVQDDEALVQAALLDGCYVITSDVPQADADAQTVHDRYCDLEHVERAFRTFKTAHLELRPVFVTKQSSTQAHVFVVMLALLLQRELERCWAPFDVTVAEGLDALSAIHTQRVTLGHVTIDDIPKPTDLGARLLAALDVTLPAALPLPPARVHTKKSLVPSRLQ